MKFEFLYEERVEGAWVGELEGYAILRRDQQSDLDWVLEAIVLNGRAWSDAKGRAEPVEVTLPEKHPISLKLQLWLHSEQRREIDDRWARYVHNARAERIAVL